MQQHISHIQGNIHPLHKMVVLEACEASKIKPFQLVSSPQKRSAKELTCAGIVIDPDVTRVADAHEGARGVNAHGVLPTVVLPFSALINI